MLLVVTDKEAEEELLLLEFEEVDCAVTRLSWTSASNVHTANDSEQQRRARRIVKKGKRGYEKKEKERKERGGRGGRREKGK